jgi:hypothetical protein
MPLSRFRIFELLRGIIWREHGVIYLALIAFE